MKYRMCDRDKRFLDAVEIGAMELGLQNPAYALMVTRSQSPGYTVAMIDVAFGPRPSAQLVSCELVAATAADLRRAIRDAFVTNEREPNKLVFMLEEKRKGRKVSGTWTMIDPERLDPVIFTDRLVVTSYEQAV